MASKPDEKFYWICIAGEHTLVTSKCSLRDFLKQIELDWDCNRELLERFSEAEDFIVLRSSDELGWQRIKLVAPKDDWSTIVVSK